MKISQLEFPPNFVLIGSYQTESQGFILFKDVQEGVEQAFIVQELNYVDNKLTPVFILPTGILLSEESVKVEVRLMVRFL